MTLTASPNDTIWRSLLRRIIRPQRMVYFATQQYGAGRAVVDAGAQVYGARAGGGEIFDIYVSAMTGNDTTGNGSLALPYATIGKALSVVNNNQSIGVMNGTYRERALGTSITKTGVTIKNVSGNSPVVSGSVEYAYGLWSKTGGYTNVYEAAYTPNYCCGVWHSAVTLVEKTSIALVDATANTFYFDNAGNKLYINVGGVPGNVEVWTSNWDVIFWLKNGWALDGFVLQYTPYIAIFNSGATVNVTIKNCTIRYQRASSVFGGGGTALIRLFGPGTISNCTLLGEHLSYSYIVHVTTGATACAITNVTTDGGGTGFWIGAGTGHVVDSCIASNCTEDGFNVAAAVATTVSATFRYCTAYNCSHAGFRNGNQTALLHHCLSYKTSGTMLYGYVADPAAVTQFYHCVAYATGRGWIVQTNSECAVNNCITKACTTAGYYINPAYTPTGARDHNCADNTSNYSNWPQGANDIVNDPLFVNPPTDFGLQAGSPCINTGLFIAGVSETNPPDIGRYET